MTVSIILLLLMGSGLELVSSSPHSVLERYEERLNSALLKRTGTPRTVKRYKCVEEYVTYDQHGRAVTSYQGTRFTTTMEPPVYRTSGEREIRRKPAKKVTISMNKDHAETTTPIAMTSTSKTSSTTSQKPFDEMNDEEADRIIEEMYLKKKESHGSESPTEIPQTTPPTQKASSQPQKPQRSYATDSTASASSHSGVERYKQQNKIESEESDDDYPNSLYHRGSRKRPYEMSTYDDYDDDLPVYRPLRREYRMRRRRPILFSDDFSDDVDFEQRLSNTPHRQTTRDLSPLRSMKRLRHQMPLNPPYRQQMPTPMGLPVSASTNMLHRPMPLPMVPNLGGVPPPAPHPLQPMPLPPMPPGMVPLPPAPVPSPQPLQPIQQQSSTNVRPGNEEVLKMKPILQANAQEMQDANEASCSKITTIAKNFGIKDVSKWARSNCSFLQMYAPTASCELIFHFIDSCKSKKFL